MSAVTAGTQAGCRQPRRIAVEPEDPGRRGASRSLSSQVVAVGQAIEFIEAKGTDPG